MVGRFARWLTAHPELARELRGGPVDLVLQDAGRIVLRTADELDHTLSVRGFDLRGPEPTDPLDSLRPEPADTTIALAPDAGAVGWGEIGAGVGATSWAELADKSPEAREFAVREGLVFPDPLPRLGGPDYRASREGLHRIAEVMGAARQSLTGRFGLRGRADGVTTPGFPEDAWLQPVMLFDDDGGRLAVLPAPDGEGAALAGLSARAAGEHLVHAFLERGVTLPLVTSSLSEEPCPEPPAGFGTLLSFGTNVLARSRYEAGPDASSIQLWPEHFDQAFDCRRVTCGVGPGDGGDPEPYFYALTDNPEGPLPEPGQWRTEPWKGALLHWSDLRAATASGDEALELVKQFFASGLATRL